MRTHCQATLAIPYCLDYSLHSLSGELGHNQFTRAGHSESVARPMTGRPVRRVFRVRGGWAPILREATCRPDFPSADCRVSIGAGLEFFVGDYLTGIDGVSDTFGELLVAQMHHVKQGRTMAEAIDVFIQAVVGRVVVSVHARALSGEFAPKIGRCSHEGKPR